MSTLAPTISADNLRTARERAGHSIVAVALVCEVESSEVEHWESDRPEDALAHSGTLAELYEVDPGFLEDQQPDGGQVRTDLPAAPPPPARSRRPAKRAAKAKPATKRSAPRPRKRQALPTKGAATRANQPTGVRQTSSTAPVTDVSTAVRVAIAVAWLEPDKLQIAAGVAGVCEPANGNTDVIARTAVAIVSLPDETRAALSILAGLGNADEIDIGLAIGHADPPLVAEVQRLLVDVGLSAGGPEVRPYAVAASIAALDPEIRLTLAEVAALATTDALPVFPG